MSQDIRVLHVDDDTQFSDLTVEFLETIDERLIVETMTEPRAALDEISPDQYDCVVSDYDMPEMNGIAFLEAVRDRYGDLPFILFTGKGSEEVASDAISAGVTDYLQKNPGSDQFHLLVNRITNAVEQTRATRAAEETERRLRELAENTTDALWMFSGDWEELLFVNSVVTDLFGVTPAELYREPDRFRNHIHPTHRDQVERAMEQVTQGYPIELEYKVTPPTGSPRWVWVSGEPILDEDGEVMRIVGFTRDITDRKRRERERREAARRLDLVLDTVQACIWMRDDDRRFLLANDRFHKAFGVDPGIDVVGCLAADLVDDETASAISALDDEVLETGEPLERERTLPAEDGDATYLVRITPLFDETGEISVTCGIATDITDRKRRVERLHAHAERLSAMSGVVTGDLLPAVGAGDGDIPRAVVDALAAMARRQTPETGPVAVEDVARRAWDHVDPAGDEIDLAAPPTIVADDRLLEQLFRSLLRGLGGADGGQTVTVGGLETGFFVGTSNVQLGGFSEGQDIESAADGWGAHLAVARWIAEQHGWEPCVESPDGATRVTFRDVDLVAD